jgi:hypothetical protein
LRQGVVGSLQENIVIVQTFDPTKMPPANCVWQDKGPFQLVIAIRTAELPNDLAGKRAPRSKHYVRIAQSGMKELVVIPRFLRIRKINTQQTVEGISLCFSSSSISPSEGETKRVVIRDQSEGMN